MTSLCFRDESDEQEEGADKAENDGGCPHGGDTKDAGTVSGDRHYETSENPSSGPRLKYSIACRNGL